MKKSLFPLFLALITSNYAMAVDATYTNLEVTGQADFLGNTFSFGTLSGTGGGTAISYSFIDVSGTVAAKYVLVSGRTAQDWTWAQMSGSTSVPMMTLDSYNRLNIYSGTNALSPVIVLDANNGQISINGQTIGGGSGIWTTSGSNVIMNSGYVGIGVTDPACAEDLYGVFRVRAADNAWPTSGVGVEVVFDPSANLGVIQAYDRDTGSYRPMALAGSTTSIYSGNANLTVFIDEDGHVGIGTGDPQFTVDIAGDINFTGNIYRNGASLMSGSAGFDTLNLPITSSTSGMINQDGQSLIHTYGSGNFFAGAGAGNFTLTGASNVGIGNNALHSVTGGASNVAIGSNALSSSGTTYNSIAIGVNALSSSGTTSHDNIALGLSTLQIHTGFYNVAIGTLAMNNSKGNGNIALGYQAGRIALGGTYNNNIYIGYQAGLAGTNNLTNAIAIGANSQVGASNSMALGGTGTNAVKVGIGSATPAYTLDVVGDVNFSGNIYKNGTLISGTSASGVFGSISIGGGSLGGSGLFVVGTGSAGGARSISIGNSSNATGTSAIAVGEYASASGVNATALGYNVTAQSYGELVVGQYNVLQGSGTSWAGSDDLFVVGNGSGTSSRTNAFVVKKNGDATLNGALTISGTSTASSKISHGGLTVTGSAVTSGTQTTYVTTGSNVLLVPQQGDLSMGQYTAGATPQ